MSLFFMFNLLHMPAGVVPCTLVRQDECNYDDDGGVNDSWAKGTRACMVGAEGLPVGVQIAALPFRDELCLGIMRELEQV
jgi:fatty acid amide hydrolase